MTKTIAFNEYRVRNVEGQLELTEEAKASYKSAKNVAKRTRQRRRKTR